MDDTALKSLIARAESGNADAQYELALLILDDSSVDDDSWDVDSAANAKVLEQGTRWLYLAARNGSTDAQTDLAKRYHYGIDFPENQSKAFEWFKTAADNECAEAQFFLGELYTADDVVAYDIETALAWYERSAKNGYQWAQLALFDIYRNGADLSLPDLEKSLYWGRKAGEQGNLAAQVSLGRIFFEGEIAERNPLEAAFWLHLASDLDDEAKYLLATLYFSGHGVEKNIARSAELFRSLAKKGDADAMVQLAIVLSEMFRPPHDEIHSWLIKASELGHLHAREMLEEIEASDAQEKAVQEEFKAVDGPARTASQWRALAEAGDADAQFSLAQMLEDGRDIQGDFEEAVRWYKRAANQGHVGALWHLSVCYQSGLGVEPNEVKALELLQEAANGGNSDAQLQLGWQFFFGIFVSENKQKAFQYFRKASEQWNLNALVWQGHCYQHGAGVVSDKRKACDLYRKAADLGVVNAQFKLGMMYLSGQGVEPCSVEAARWLALAAKYNHTGALVELGRMYAAGNGVEQSNQQADIYFRRAAELGDAEGKFGEPSVPDDLVENDLWHGQMIANRFAVLARLYGNDMYSAFKAKNVFSERIVALKVFESKLDSNDMAMQRFQREAKAISRLDHPNLIRLQDFGLTGAMQPYVVHDFVSGVSLKELLRQEGAFEFERCISIFVQIIDGLSHAHDSGVAHGDIKPENIILTDARTPMECARLVDFGIARLFSTDDERDPLARSGSVNGMPSYMSPEQCSGQALDTRSDIYALGCVLFEALSGSRAVAGGSYFETVCSHLFQTPVSLIERKPDANFCPQLDVILQKMMAKDQNLRYQDLHALKEDLMRLRAAAA